MGGLDHGVLIDLAKEIGVLGALERQTGKLLAQKWAGGEQDSTDKSIMQVGAKRANQLIKVLSMVAEFHDMELVVGNDGDFELRKK